MRKVDKQAWSYIFFYEDDRNSCAGKSGKRRVVSQC